MEFTWSRYQSDVFDAVANPHSGNLVIVARAGASKTTTGVEAIRRLLRKPVVAGMTSLDLDTGNVDGEPQIAFLAFNKSIADELKTKLPGTVTSSTFHSLGFAALKQYIKGYVKVDGNKMRKIANDMVRRGDVDAITADYLVDPALRLVNLGRDMGIGVLELDTDESWMKIIHHFEIDIEAADEVFQNRDPYAELIQLARVLLHKSIDIATYDKVVDFGDMLYLCVKFPVPMYSYDFVFVDEAQDTNPVQVAIIKKILKPGGKLVAIGDPAQAIYGFRGASSDAIDVIIDEFNATTLPLSISYRCSKEVVRLAQRYVPDIEFSEAAIDGFTGPVGADWTFRAFTADDVVLCRNTAPLISMAYKLIARKIPCKVLGREIGQGLVALIKSLKPKGVDGLESKLNAYCDEKISQYMAKGEEGKAQALDDKRESILAAIESLPTDATVPQLIAHIEGLFSNQNAPVLTLCTIHKSKGLEFGTVYHLDSFLVPSKFARQAWQLAQENHLIYVAITRAKNSLFFIQSKGMKWDA